MACLHREWCREWFARTARHRPEETVPSGQHHTRPVAQVKRRRRCGTSGFRPTRPE